MTTSVASVAEPALPGPLDDRFPCLDAFRGIGMVMVMVFHVYFTTRNPNSHPRGVFGPFLAHGDAGVAMFLVLSAFLLFRPYFAAQLAARPPMSPRRFYRHRVLRIFPGYWLALTVVVVVFGISFTGPRQLLTFYGLFQVYGSGQVLAPQFQPIYQAWSLGVELLFYLLLPLFAVLLRRWGADRPPARQVRHALMFAGAIYVAGVAFRLWLLATEPSWERSGVLWLPNWLDVLAIGLALAVVSVWSAHTGRTPGAIAWLAQRPALCWLIAFGIFFMVTRIPVPINPIQIAGKEYMVRQFCYGLFSAFFMLPAMFGDQRAGVIRRFLRQPVMVFLGTVSLGVYLFHLVFIRKAEQWTGHTFFNADFWTILAIALPLTLAAGTLSYYIVERPFLLMKDRSPRAAMRTLLGRVGAS
jgi:peptidoglycan/LPS O-acetylase OafA/YrhL